MTQLPKPFDNKEEQLVAGAVLATTADTTAGEVEKAVKLGDLLCDNEWLYARWMIDENQDGVYHVFRGSQISDSFWGQGEFGLALLEAVEWVWRNSSHHIEFLPEAARPELVADDPSQPSQYPVYYYGGYLVRIANAGRRLVLPKGLITNFVEVAESELKKAVQAAGN